LVQYFSPAALHPATRFTNRLPSIHKAAKFLQDLIIRHQIYSRHPESGEYFLVSLLGRVRKLFKLLIPIFIKRWRKIERPRKERYKRHTLSCYVFATMDKQPRDGPLPTGTADEFCFECHLFPLQLLQILLPPTNLVLPMENFPAALNSAEQAGLDGSASASKWVAIKILNLLSVHLSWHLS
jgi:hypothetical protein